MSIKKLRKKIIRLGLGKVSIRRLSNDVIENMNHAGYYFDKNKSRNKKKVKQLLKYICVNKQIYKTIKEDLKAIVDVHYSKNINVKDYYTNAIYMFVDLHLSEIE